jgi:hypothetical protein
MKKKNNQRRKSWIDLWPQTWLLREHSLFWHHTLALRLGWGHWWQPYPRAEKQECLQWHLPCRTTNRCHMQMDVILVTVPQPILSEVFSKNVILTPAAAGNNMFVHLCWWWRMEHKQNGSWCWFRAFRAMRWGWGDLPLGQSLSSVAVVSCLLHTKRPAVGQGLGGA